MGWLRSGHGAEKPATSNCGLIGPPARQTLSFLAGTAPVGRFSFYLLDKYISACQYILVKVVGRRRAKNAIYTLFANSTNSMQGTIKTLTDKGFGFIGAEGMEKDVFFHSNSLVGVSFDELREGETVTFETQESDKGLNAVNVQRVA